MLKIVAEINSGIIGKRSACIKYGLNRNFLTLFICNFSVRILVEPLGLQLFHDITEKQCKGFLDETEHLQSLQRNKH
jgi:hypothetical protein